MISITVVKEKDERVGKDEYRDSLKVVSQRKSSRRPNSHDKNNSIRYSYFFVSEQFIDKLVFRTGPVTDYGCKTGETGLSFSRLKPLSNPGSIVLPESQNICIFPSYLTNISPVSLEDC